jgi:hypothetical protein
LGVAEIFNRSEAAFSAGAAAQLIGITPETLRDWRRHGFLDGIGTQHNNRWFYRKAECDALRAAFKRSLEPKPTLIDFIREEMKGLIDER